MKNIWGKSALGIMIGLLLAAMPALATDQAPAQNFVSPVASQTSLERQVRHELLMLPYYGVFDNLEFQVQGSHVALYGQVVWPALKSQAETAVKDIPGVTSVANRIEVLPLSSSDNAIRFAVYRAVFGANSMYRYAMGANPSIHIIVDNGNVTLVGAVASKMDSQIAYLQAMSVPGVFSVTNQLRVGLV
jgi:osmotically-inducible protein OsmY